MAFDSWLQHPYPGSSHWREPLGDQVQHTDLSDRHGISGFVRAGALGASVPVLVGRFCSAGSGPGGWPLPTGISLLGRVHHVMPSEEETQDRGSTHL